MPIAARIWSRPIVWKAVLILLIAHQCDGLARPADSRATVVPTYTVHARRFAFQPGEITLKRGQAAKLVLVSDDVAHGLAVKGLGIRADIAKGRRTEILVTPSQNGDFFGSCSVYCGSGHRDMELLIHVVD